MLTLCQPRLCWISPLMAIFCISLHFVLVDLTSPARGRCLVLVVVYFNPVAVGILEIDLADSVGTGAYFAIALEVAVFHLEMVEAGHEILQRSDAEGHVNFDVMVRGLGGASDYVQLLVRAGAKPDVAAVFEGVGDFLEAHDLFVEVDALLHVTDVHCGVIQLRSLVCRNGLSEERSGGQQSGQKEGNPEFSPESIHGWASYNTGPPTGNRKSSLSCGTPFPRGDLLQDSQGAEGIVESAVFAGRGTGEHFFGPVQDRSARFDDAFGQFGMVELEDRAFVEPSPRKCWERNWWIESYNYLFWRRGFPVTRTTGVGNIDHITCALWPVSVAACS